MKIVVIGAGVAGLATGWRLAQSGCDVVVLDRAAPGRGATWAAAGMIAATAESTENERLAEYGLYAARLWPSFADEIERASGQRISYRRDGSLIVSASAAPLPSAQNWPGVSLLSSEEAHGLEPMLGDGIARALFAPDDAQVDNRALGTALAAAFVRAGGTLTLNEAVIRFEMAQTRVAGVRTPFGLHRADAFVIAAGAWSALAHGLPPDCLPAVIPVKGEMIALSPPAGAALPTRLVRDHAVYLVPRGDRLLVGATVSRDGFDTRATQKGGQWLQAGAVALMPALRGWRLCEHWAGLRPGSADDLPLVGETPVPGLFIASGQYRNGILLAPAIAEAMRSLILEQRRGPEILAFDPNRFSSKPLAGANGVG